jgi:hypothetical protein
MLLEGKNVVGVLLSVLGTWSLFSACFKLNVESRYTSRACALRPSLVSHRHSWVDMEFPEITFSVSATTTGYSSAQHSKKTSKRSKKKKEALAAEFKPADPAEQQTVDAGEQQTVVDKCAVPHPTAEESSPATAKEPISSPRAHVDIPTTCPARSASGCDDADDGPSPDSSSSSPSSSDAEDETEMMQALGLPVPPTSSPRTSSPPPSPSLSRAAGHLPPPRAAAGASRSTLLIHR